jgi:hypothetical protein
MILTPTHEFQDEEPQTNANNAYVCATRCSGKLVWVVVVDISIVASYSVGCDETNSRSAPCAVLPKSCRRARDPFGWPATPRMLPSGVARLESTGRKHSPHSKQIPTPRQRRSVSRTCHIRSSTPADQAQHHGSIMGLGTSRRPVLDFFFNRVWGLSRHIKAVQCQ